MCPRIGLCFLCFFLFGPIQKKCTPNGQKKKHARSFHASKEAGNPFQRLFLPRFRSPRATVNLFPSSFRLVSLLVPSSWWVSSTTPRSVLLPAFKIFTSRSLLPQDIMAEEGQVPKIPMNQEALLSSSSDSSDEEDDNLVVHTNKNHHGAPLDSDVTSMATGTESSFKNWFEDDCHVPPDDKIPYLLISHTRTIILINTEIMQLAQCENEAVCSFQAYVHRDRLSENTPSVNKHAKSTFDVYS